MKIKNLRINSKKLKIKDCKGISSVKGLMFNSMNNIDGALIYANKIWMPFVKHNLDLLFLDENFRLLKKQLAVPATLNPKTWKIYECSDAKYCLELKAGTIKANNGTKIKI